MDVDVDRVRGSGGAAPAGQLRTPVDEAVSLVTQLLDQAPGIRARTTSQALLAGRGTAGPDGAAAAEGRCSAGRRCGPPGVTQPKRGAVPRGSAVAAIHQVAPSTMPAASAQGQCLEQRSGAQVLEVRARRKGTRCTPRSCGCSSSAGLRRDKDPRRGRNGRARPARGPASGLHRLVRDPHGPPYGNRKVHRRVHGGGGAAPDCARLAAHLRLLVDVHVHSRVIMRILRHADLAVTWRSTPVPARRHRGAQTTR